LRGTTYAERILALRRDGWDITPILDRGELPTFAAPGTPAMDVGLRLRAGPVRTVAQLDGLTTRFGMGRHEVAEVAARIDTIPHLRLTTLHAMVGAATHIPVDLFVEALLVGARVWASLRRRHPTLTELNIGGGVPPLGDRYDHSGFLHRLFSGLGTVAGEAGVKPPDLTFELGSLVAAESGCHVFKVIQHKAVDAPGAVPWAIVGGGLMAAIPDMLLIDRSFRFLAVANADAPAERFVVGDVTCDPDGRYPPQQAAETAIFLPRPAAGEPSHLLIQGVGAYQEILAGVRGAHHCGLLEAIELILEPDATGGGSRARIMPRQTAADAAAVLGYTPAAARALAQTMGTMPKGLGEE
jgi:diaminopimelate decarboxylase